MDTFRRLMEISNRIDHLEHAAEWITKETVHADNVVSQTGTLICAIADELRERVYELVRHVEQTLDVEQVH